MSAFLELSKKGLSDATAQEVMRAALELWHKNYLPSLSGLSVEDKRVAGYLLDRLSRFNCLSAEQKTKLQEVAQSAKADVPHRESQLKVDTLAKQWGLDYDLRPFMKDLLPLQTRHFKRSFANRTETAA
ncbi:hypothetical protein [Marinobacter sp. HN1S83]|uniref:hypothetical protein n=1 Tax=Marinobacter sp. HN1S83 TaxID=3382301 RepID=UPI00387AB628